MVLQSVWYNSMVVARSSKMKLKPQREVRDIAECTAPVTGVSVVCDLWLCAVATLNSLVHPPNSLEWPSDWHQTNDYDEWHSHDWKSTATCFGSDPISLPHAYTRLKTRYPYWPIVTQASLTTQSRRQVDIHLWTSSVKMIYVIANLFNVIYASKCNHFDFKISWWGNECIP